MISLIHSVLFYCDVVNQQPMAYSCIIKIKGHFVSAGGFIVEVIQEIKDESLTEQRKHPVFSDPVTRKGEWESLEIIIKVVI